MPLPLEFDIVCPFVGTDYDPRPLPRLPINVSLRGGSPPTESLRPILDTGAEYTVFDGSMALRLGWTEDAVMARAERALPIYGLNAAGPPVVGYLHPMTCLISLGGRFASLAIHAFLTPPNTISTPVLGRTGFFEYVDFALVQAERRFYLRFRDPSVLHSAW